MPDGPSAHSSARPPSAAPAAQPHRQAQPGRLLVFDLDGTLVDSEPDVTSALNEILLEWGYGPVTPAEVAPMIGDGIPALVTRAFVARGARAAEAAQALPRYMRLYEASATDVTRPYADVRGTLIDLRQQGYRTAVCTNKPQQLAETVLGRLGLTVFFDGIAGGDRYPAMKPAAEPLLSLIAELGARPAHAVMIGDSENDAAAAAAAHVPLVIMRYGYARGDPATFGAAAIVDHFADLPETLARLRLTP